jgi:hypothetical protein
VCGRRQPRRVPPMRIEHRLQIEGRPADSFENLSSRGFSSKSIAQLSLELLDCASKVLLSLDGGCVGRHDCAQSIEWRLLVSAGRYTKRLSTHPTLCQSDAPCSVLARDVCFRAARSAAAPTDPCLSLAHIHRRSRPRFTSKNGITCAEGKALPARMNLTQSGCLPCGPIAMQQPMWCTLRTPTLAKHL